MEYKKIVINSSDGSKHYGLHVKDGSNKIIFYTISMEKANDLANTIENTVIGFETVDSDL